jgi:hypothetical protein
MCRHFKSLQAIENEGKGKPQFSPPVSEKTIDGFFRVSPTSEATAGKFTPIL